MNLPPLPLVDGVLFVDNSGWLEPLQMCSRKLEYRQLEQRTPTAESISLVFGRALHTALEYRYVRYQNQPPDILCDQDVSDLLQEHFANVEVPEGEFRTLNWCVEILRRYNERYTIEPFNLLKYKQPIECPHCHDQNREKCVWCLGTGWRELMVELPFVLPLYVAKYNGQEIPVAYTGRIDLPTSEDGRIFVTDHKSTGQLGPQFFDRMKMSAQQKGYAWAFQELTGQRVNGYRINAIRTKEPPQYVLANVPAKTGKKQSPEEWWNESFQRETYYIKDGELEEWKNNSINLMERFFWEYSRNFMPMQTTSCTMFGRCAYFEVCMLEPTSREGMLAGGQFRTNDWSPLNKTKQQNTNI